jgi:hypothetical protein
MQRINKKNLSYKLLLISGIIVAVLGVILIWSSRRTQEITIQNRQITTYDDRLEINSAGNSEVLSTNQYSSGLQFSYILRPGFQFPYAGIVIPLKDSNGNFLDCTRFDRLNISIGSKRLFDCKLYLKVFDPAVSEANNPLSERYFKKDLILDTAPVTVSIPLKEFTEPEWWYQKNNLTLKDVAQQISRK